ncbi:MULTISPECIES: DUF5343 domain-containing protein [Methylobacter]
MANGDTSFPMIADSSWWKLRVLFRRKVPTIVTPTYLATALSMGEASARANLIGPFKKIGIIDDDGKPTDLAHDWRDDHKYASVCETLIETCYPQELKDLFHSPDANIQRLTNWFMSHTRCGEPTAKKYARFYLLLLKADFKEAEIATNNKEQKVKAVTKSSEKNKPLLVTPATSQQQEVVLQNPAIVAPAQTSVVPRMLNNSPELHINIQLHISPESSTEQIDKIFESMSKHLKDFNK